MAHTATGLRMNALMLNAGIPDCKGQGG